MKKRITIGRRRKRPGARQAARRLIRELPSLFKLVFRLLRDPKVAGLDKLLFGAVGVYMMTPVDLIPDFLGVLGWVDDLYLLGLALGRLMASSGPDTLLRHWDGDPRALGYLVDGVDELGSMLPDRIRKALFGVSRNPEQLKKRGRRVKRIRVDEDDGVRLEEED